MERKYNFVYKTTNTINGKIYIGVHKTDDIDDGYIGSGRAMKSAIEKYGKDCFVREILKQFPTYIEALNYEAELVTEEFVKETTNYNLNTGGKQNVILSSESINMMRETHKLFWSSNKSDNRRRIISEDKRTLWKSLEYRTKMETIFSSSDRNEKLSINLRKWIEENPEAHKARMDKINKNPEKIRKMVEKQTGRAYTEERKKNISLSLVGKRKGEENSNFLGYYITPKGNFSSLKDAADANMCSPVGVRDRCVIKNKNAIKLKSKISDKSNSITDSMVGKTWNECGWGFEGAV